MAHCLKCFAATKATINYQKCTKCGHTWCPWCTGHTSRDCPKCGAGQSDVENDRDIIDR